MATSYTSLLGLALPVTGELSGTWGDTVNNYISNYIDAAVAGAQTVTTDTTLTKTTGTSLGSTSSQYAIIIASPASANITITAPAASKIYTIINTSATYTVKIVGAGPTTGVTLNASEKAQVAWNGSDFVRVGSTSVFGSPSASMTLDTSGNLGLGTTPSAWNTSAKAYTNAAGSFYNIGTTIAGIIQNAYLDSGGIYKYVNTGEASYFAQTAGAFAWASVTSGAGGATAGLTEKMRLDSSGNLGIGTSSPTTKLDVSSSGTTTLRVNRVGVADVYLTAGANGIYGLDTASTNLGFGVNNSLKMTLDGSGNLGIGTSSPVTKFAVQDQARFEVTGVSASAIATQALNIARTATVEQQIYGSSVALYTGASGSQSRNAVLDSSGNLGLGVPPNAWFSNYKALQIGAYTALAQSGSSNTFLLNNAYVNAAGTTTYLNTAAASYYNQSAGLHSWHNAPSGTAGDPITFTQAMTLDASGRLGIGTTSPDINSGTKLTVKGIYVDEGGSDAGYGWQIVSSGSGVTPLQLIAPTITFSTGANLARSERMRLDSSGNLLIGETSLSNAAGWDKLVQIYATNYSALSLKNAYRQWDVAVNGSSGTLRFYDVTAGSDRMNIDSSGNVLIGKTTSGSFNGRLAVSSSTGNSSIGTLQSSGTSALDTGISINQGNQGGCLLLVASRNTSSGTNTDAAVYIVRFYYDGNNAPTTTYVGGSSDFVAFGVSGSNTLTVQNSAGGNVAYSWFGNK